MGICRYHPMNSAELLDEVMDVYKRSFGKQLAITIIINIIFAVTAGALTVFGILAATFAIVSSAASESSYFFLAAAAVILFFLILMVYSAVSATGSAFVTKLSYLNEPCDIGNVLKMSLKKLFPAITAGLANMIVMLPFLVLLALLIYFYIRIIISFEQEGLSSLSSVLIWGFVFLAITVIILAVLLSALTMITVCVSIFENRYFFGAFARGYRLIKPDFLKIMGLSVIWSLITFAVSYSLSSFFDVISLMGWFLPEGGAAAFTMFSLMASSSVSAVLGILVAPLAGIFSTLIYINQRFKHEGLDIELNLSLLAQDRQRQAYYNNAND